MAHSKQIMFIILTLMAVSGCTSGQDITPVVKAVPEVQQFLKEHPNAKITVTYWSKEDVASLEQEISKQCGKPITPVAMYKATISEGDIKSIAWIDAESRMVLCSTIEGKGGEPKSLPETSMPTATQTPTPVITSTSVITSTPSPVPTSGLDSVELKQGYRLYLARVDGVTETIMSDGTIMYSKRSNNAQILLQLISGARVIDELVLTEGGLEYNIYDAGRLIVKVDFRSLLLGEVSYMVRLDNLKQYDRDGAGIIYSKDIVTLTKSYPPPTAPSGAGVKLTVDNPAKSTPINTPATYVLTVTNTGNSADTYTFTPLQALPGTIIAFSMPSITLDRGLSGSVQFSYTATGPGIFIVNVTATSQTDHAKRSTVTTTTTVG